MIRCQECESEVSENDAFCPFCGISIQVVAPIPAVIIEEPVPEPEPDLDSTIMMAPVEAEKLVSKETTAEPSEPEPIFESVETSEKAEIESPQPVDEPEASSEDDPDSIELDDAPVPAILSDLVVSDGSNISETTFEPVGEPESFVEDVAEPVAEEVPTPEAPNEFNFSAPAAPVNEEPQVSFDIAPESAELAASIVEENSVETEFAAADESEPEKDERPENDSAIQMPADELDEHDPFKHSSAFDSVRIMENQIPDMLDEADTRVPFRPAGEEIKERIHEEVLSNENVVHTTGSTSVTTDEGETDGKKAPKLKPLQEGTLLNSRYEIVRKIGGGGMGAVYLASDNNLGGVLRAVKEMVQAHIEEEQQDKAINDFKRESMILSTLDHIAIPTIFDYFYDSDEGRFYLVMKYISGGDLSSRLRSAPEGKLDEPTVVEWAIQIADVLNYLHSQPSTIVYRDLKPSNIMVDGNTGRIMLIDFGIARSISQKEEKGVTAVGTMGYAPPELFSGNVEPRSDIYSLGSTVFHLLTGADPQSNPLLIFDFQKNPRPRQINPQLSDQIERILMKAVEYSADSRFASASELKRVLEEHLANLNAGNVSYGITEAPAAVSLENQHVFCGFCGQRIVATDLFCAFCGSKQPIAQQGVNSGIYSKQSITARLFVEGTGELSTPTYSLVKDENLVGRRDPMSNIFPEVDLSKYDPQTKISRRHARIWRNGASFLLEDLGSSNGTILDGVASETLRLTPHKPHPLASGDKIKIGDTVLHFVQG